MEFGIMFANTGYGATPEGATAVVQAAEAGGFTTAWVVEHVVVPSGYASEYPYDASGKMAGGNEEFDLPDPLVWLAWAAAKTTRLQLGTGILIATQRNPLVTAKEVATLDHLSGGRAVLGVGVGWLKEEFEALGVPFAGRGRRLDEYIQAIRTLWTADKASFHGEFVDFDDCISRPRPANGAVPIVIGGHTEAAARRAGRLGDGFYPGAAGADEIGVLLDVMRRSADVAGRDPDAIAVYAGAGGRPGEALDARIAALAALGVTQTITRTFPPDQLAEIGADLVARFGGMMSAEPMSTLIGKLPSQRPSRVVIEPVSPIVDGGQFAAKASLGEPIVVRADIFAEGHDAIAATLRWRPVGRGTRKSKWNELPMMPEVNDRWSATFVPDGLGRIEFEIAGWSDRASTWRNAVLKKSAAGVLTDLDVLEGERIVSAMIERVQSAKPVAMRDLARLTKLLTALARADVESLHDPGWTETFWRHTDRDPATSSATFAIDVDPVRGRFSSWYEFFPRSTVEPGKPGRHATLQDAIDRLDYVADMGFDVLYLPPVHPIGVINRKGRNNTTEAAPDDTGSPWGISDHLAVHPELGTLADVHALVAACASRGMALSLDIAFQCAPDHIWVTSHPAWFVHRADGTIQYAENPPKQYQDIYPINFESDDWRGLWEALADVFRFWIAQGITIFRVDNPHTKAFPFWEWCIGTLRAEHPELIFLAEAFTRPRVMERLAKLGFNQSYTYFAWRQSVSELRDYFTDLSTRTVDYFRPNAWPNTPDILTEQLQHGGRAVFVSRAILAATLSANWGIYGPAFELIEGRAVKAGSEEYLDSEKYQTRNWDLGDPDSIAPLITRLNTIRRAQPALQHLRTLRFHDADPGAVLCYSKTDPTGTGDPILCVVNIDGRDRHAGNVHVDPRTFGLGLGDDDEFEVHDLLGGGVYRWRGWHNYVDLTPGRGPAHVFAVRRIAGDT